MAQLAAWVEAGADPTRDGVVRRRRANLTRRIEAEFGAIFHERTVGKLLVKLGFRLISVRPEHPSADPTVQAFKKNSQASQSKLFLTLPTIGTTPPVACLAGPQEGFVFRAIALQEPVMRARRKWLLQPALLNSPRFV